MRLAVCLTVIAVLMLAGCGKKKGEGEGLPYNPFVEAFTAGQTSRFAPVYIIFNADVPENMRTAAELKKRLRIRPAVDGEFTFVNASTVMLSAKGGLERDTRYEVSASIGEWFNTGREDANFKFDFETYPLRVDLTFAGLTKSEGENGMFDLSYSLQTLDREDDSLIESLVEASGKPLMEWRHNSDGTTHTLTLKNIQADSNVRTSVTLSIARNSLGLKVGTLTTTEIPALDEFTVYDVRYVAQPERYVELTFSQNLNESDDIQGLAYIDGNKNMMLSVDGNRLRLYPDINLEGMKKVRISGAIRDVNGKYLGERDEMFEHKVEILAGRPSLVFIGLGNIMPVTPELSVQFEATLLRGVVVRVVKIFEQNIGQFLQTNELNGSESLVQTGRLVARKTIFFDDRASNFEKAGVYSIRLNELVSPEPGAIYRIIISTSKDLSAYPCDDADDRPTKEQILAMDAEMFRREAARFDAASSTYYYFGNVFGEGNDYPYYDDYEDYYERYNERYNDPCQPYYYSRLTIEKNILATNLGLIAKRGSEGDFMIHVHNLLTALPEKGVSVALYNYQRQQISVGATDGDGIARLSFDEGRGQPFYAIASQAKQRSYIRLDQGSALSLSSFDVGGETVQRGVKGFIYGERGVWRPGDTLHLSFMLNDRRASLPKGHPVVMELFTPQGQSYIRRTLTAGQLGLYAFDLPTEPDAPTGAWMARAQVGGLSFESKIRIESIKPNRLKIEMKFPADMLSAEGRNTVDLHTEWLQGAVARNLKYEIKTILTTATTTFDSFRQYVFDDPLKVFRQDGETTSEGRTDSEGNASFDLSLDDFSEAPGMLTANFTTYVFEESGDFSIDGTSMPYSPYNIYIGIQSPQTNHDEPLVTEREHRFSIVSLTKNGKPASTFVNVEVFAMRWYWWWDRTGSETMASYITDRGLTPVRHLRLTTGADGKASFNLNMNRDEWGTYLVRVSDSKGEHSTGVLAYFDWEGYGTQRNAQSRNESPAMLGFKTDKNSYEVGETMRVSFPSSEGSRATVSIENGSRVIGISEHACTAGQTTIPITVTSDMQPNAYIYITLLQPYKHPDNDLPIRMYGVAPFTVASADSRLRPVITTANGYKPEAPYSITVSEEQGRPMAYTLAIVDEGLLDLTRFKTPDPWRWFNAREAHGVSTWDMYNYIMGAYGGRIEQIFSIGGDDMLNKGPKAVVNRFVPVVKFEGPFIIRKGEKKNHTYMMPNYNGRVRIMVVSGDGYAYGNAEKSVKVSKPVMLLGTLPRVIGAEEEMTVPATVFATEDNVGKVSVTISCSNNMQVAGQSTQEISFSGKGDKTVNFKVKTGSRPGAGRITLAATAKGEKSTYETDIEIRSVERPTVRVDAYTIESGKSWKGQVAFAGVEGTNSLSMEVSSMPPIDLSRRLSSLMGYPHGCLEQITSKAFPQLYLKEFAALTAEQEQSVSTAVKATLNRYRSHFHSGSFSYWPGSSSVDEWASLYALHFLVEATNRGYSAPSGMKSQAIRQARLDASNWRADNNKYREPTQAYRLYILSIAQQAETGAMNRMRENGKLSTASLRLLGAAYAVLGRNDVATDLLGRTSPQESSAEDYAYTYGSPLRDLGLYLQTLSLIPDRAQEATTVARRISERLSGDGYLSTQETSVCLIGLSSYIKRYKSADGMSFIYTANGKSNTVATAKSIWTADLMKSVSGSAQLEVKNSGKSPLFLRLISEGIRPRSEEKTSANGVELSVSYVDERGQTLDVSKLKQGVSFEAVVTVKNPSMEKIHNLAIMQIVPSGWEILNNRYLQTESSSDNKDRLSYQDIRDDRVNSYIDELGAMRHISFRVKLSATYAGKFYLPPVYCEAMYNHLIQSNTESGTAEVY